MNQIFIGQIRAFLQLKNPTEEQIREGATLLLRAAPARNRAVYNSAMARPKSMLPWIQTDLKKHLAIFERGLETAQVKQYNREAVQRAEETLSRVPETVEMGETVPSVRIIGTIGRREDHDSLPEHIREIWDKNAERWRQLSRIHVQLSQMIAKPDYAPCDGNELCYQLRNLDDAVRDGYERYDTYQPTTADNGPESVKDGVDAFTDNVRTIQNARTAVSRGLARKTQTEASLKKIQEAVDTLFALKQIIKPETVEKLKAIGIKVPEDAKG